MDGAIVCKTCVTSGRVNPGLTPWDRRDELGFMGAVWQTIKGVSLAPAEFFARMSATGRTGSAIGFLALISIPAGLVNSVTGYFTNLALAPMFEPFIRDVYGPPGNTLSDMVVESMQPNAFSSILGLFLYPGIIVVYALITGLLCHLGLMLCGGAKEPLEATVKTTIYAYAVTFWAIVPLAGSLSWLWLLVVLVFGLSTVHKSGGFKATFAVLYAPVGCCCAIFGGTFLLAFAVAGLAGSSGAF